MSLRRAPVAMAALALPVAAWALLPFAVSLDQDVEPALPVDAGLLLPEYGDAGTYALDYRHHDEVTLAVPVHNRGPLPLRISRADLDEDELPLLVQVDDNLPLKVSPWGEAELTLTLRFDNCRYYHERSVDTWDQVDVAGSVLGRDFEEAVTLARPIALHGQVINHCPDRTLRRGDDVRPR